MPTGLSSAKEGCPELGGAAGSQGLFNSDVPFGTQRDTSLPQQKPSEVKLTSGSGSS